MRDYSLSHLADPVVISGLSTVVGKERVAIAEVLAYIAEVDARKLYAPAGYSSMFVYCVDKLHLSEDAASKRIHAARAARQYPTLFTALADGRLHLSAVCLLAPHLTPETVDELIERASHRRKSEIEDLLADPYRLPPPSRPSSQFELAPVEVDRTGTSGEHDAARAGTAPGLGLAAEHAPGHVAPALPSPPPVCHLTIRQSTRDKLRLAQAVLSHAIPSGDPSDVLDRALDLLISTTQKRRFGARGAAARAPRPRGGSSDRYIPAHVRNAVWERDKGRCTFVGTNGHTCNSIQFVEIDHVDPRRKESTVEGLRLRCRTHNQLEAERVFGSEFMARKREEARHSAKEARAQAEADPTTKDQVRDVIAGLRNLGLRYSDAKRAAESTLNLDKPTLEDRMRAALSTITPRRQPQIRSIPPPAKERV